MLNSIIMILIRKVYITMFKIIIKKLYLIGYIIIIYGIFQLGYLCFYFINTFLTNKERTVIEPNGISTISKIHFNYINIIFVVCFFIFLILLGFFIIKKGNKKG